MNTLPDTITLSHHLSGLLSDGKSWQEQVNVLTRKEFINSSTTFPVEIITCKLKDGQVINLFCKYLEE